MFHTLIGVDSNSVQCITCGQTFDDDCHPDWVPCESSATDSAHVWTPTVGISRQIGQGYIPAMEFCGAEVTVETYSRNIPQHCHAEV